jgi:hypothetical protein
MPWTLWGVNITETQFNSNPELQNLPCIKTPANKADLQQEAALFGSRWEYPKLKDAWVKHHTHPEAASTRNSNPDHVLDQASASFHGHSQSPPVFQPD